MRIEGARDRWAAALFGGASLMIMALPLLMLVEVVGAGLPRLSWEFLYAPPMDAGRAGGIGPMIVSTLAILAVCLCAALPVGLGCALYLAECVPAGAAPPARWDTASMYSAGCRRSSSVSSATACSP